MLNAIFQCSVSANTAMQVLVMYQFCWKVVLVRPPSPSSVQKTVFLARPHLGSCWGIDRASLVHTCTCRRTVRTTHVYMSPQIPQLKWHVSSPVVSAVLVSAVLADSFRVARVFGARDAPGWWPADSGGQSGVASNHPGDLTAFIIDCSWSWSGPGPLRQHGKHPCTVNGVIDDEHPV